MDTKSAYLGMIASSTLLVLSACGGNSGSGVVAAPAPNLTITPATEPETPAPLPNFNTAEYRRSNGLDNINALGAYNQGGTGEGVILAIIDSGIDVNNAEFSGRIHPNSTNTAGTASDIQDPDGHGTFVASVAAGDNNGIGTHGVAFDADILALRTDREGSCDSDDGCSHFDSDIAQAVDVARDTGAKVINMSLGGGGASFALRNAIDRASEDDIITVISAGNDGDANPDSFALVAQTQSANGRVLIAGYVDDDNVISDNSNRAGSAADVFVVAPGEGIRATGLDGDEFLVSGSSFSAPHVTGAIAVLYDLFPNLTADQMIELITSTATDLGAPGIDEIYGHGLINLEEAVQPQGTMQTAAPTAAGSVSMTMLDTNVQTSSAFGDAIPAGLNGARTVALDRFQRPYEVDLAPFASVQQRQLGLGALLDTRAEIAHSQIGNADGMLFAQVSMQHSQPLAPHLLEQFSGAFADLADQRRVTGRMTILLGDIALKSAFNAAPDQPLEPLRQARLTSLRDTDSVSYGIGRAPSGSAFSVVYQLSDAVDIGLDTNYAAQRDTRLQASNDVLTSAQSALSLTYHTARGTSVSMALGAVVEDGQVFGAQADNGALSLAQGTRTLYAQSAVRHWLTDDTYVRAVGAYGSAQLEAPDTASLIGASGPVGISSWSIDLRSNQPFTANDAVLLSVSQPQRVETGSAALNIPGQSTTWFSLNPTGRQIDTEVAYQIPLAGLGALSANALMRRDLGHIAGNHDMAGFIQLSSQF